MACHSTREGTEESRGCVQLSLPCQDVRSPCPPWGSGLESSEIISLIIASPPCAPNALTNNMHVGTCCYWSDNVRVVDCGLKEKHVLLSIHLFHFPRTHTHRSGLDTPPHPFRPNVAAYCGLASCRCTLQRMDHGTSQDGGRMLDR